MRKNYLFWGAVLMFLGAAFWSLYLVLDHQVRDSRDWVPIILLLIVGVMAWRKAKSIEPL